MSPPVYPFLIWHVQSAAKSVDGRWKKKIYSRVAFSFFQFLASQRKNLDVGRANRNSFCCSHLSAGSSPSIPVCCPFYSVTLSLAFISQLSQSFSQGPPRHPIRRRISFPFYCWMTRQTATITDSTLYTILKFPPIIRLCVIQLHVASSHAKNGYRIALFDLL